MAVLHLLANPLAMDSCRAALADHDALLLLGDGVLAHRSAVESGVQVAVLADDARQRDVETNAPVMHLSYHGFVEWVVAYSHSVTWR